MKNFEHITKYFEITIDNMAIIKYNKFGLKR